MILFTVEVAVSSGGGEELDEGKEEEEEEVDVGMESVRGKGICVLADRLSMRVAIPDEPASEVEVMVEEEEEESEGAGSLALGVIDDDDDDDKVDDVDVEE